MIDFSETVSPVIYRLGWVLVHFVWQGAAVAFLLGVGLWQCGRGRATARYGMAVGAMVVMIGGAVVTFFVMTGAEQGGRVVSVSPPREAGSLPAFFVAPSPDRQIAPTPHSADLPIGSLPDGRGSDAVSFAERLRPVLPVFVGGWLLGVVVLAVYHFGGFVAVERLKRIRTSLPTAAAEAMVKELARRMGVGKGVRLLGSAVVGVPMVAGYFRPVVLVPVSVLSGLSMQELEAILAHELAHIRRHDYVVNLVQAMVETVLFYHPAVWWVSRQIRREREHCCDDVAAAVCGDRVVYVQALASLEELRPWASTPVLAVGATGSPVVERVRRLLNVPGNRSSLRTRSALAAALIVTLISVLLPLACAQQRRNATIAEPAATSQPSSQPSVMVIPPDSGRIVLFVNAGELCMQYGDQTIKAKTLSFQLSPPHQDKSFICDIEQGGRPRLCEAGGRWLSIGDRIEIDSSTGRFGASGGIWPRLENMASAAAATKPGVKPEPQVGKIQIDYKTQLITLENALTAAKEELAAAKAKKLPADAIDALQIESILMRGELSQWANFAESQAPIDEHLRDVSFKAEDSQFSAGDEIRITAIRGTSEKLGPGNTYLISGTYRLESQDRATLEVYVTSDATSLIPNHHDPYDSRQTIWIDKGRGTFTVLLPFMSKGRPHVSFYPSNRGSSFGGVYFCSVKPLAEVQILVSPTEVSYQGKVVTWEALGKVLEAVPERGNTFLAMKFTTDQMTLKRYHEAMYQASQLAERLGFKYVSDTGVERAEGGK
ncbi:MAG: M56 family metallopeptidase [Phycisphaerales bacterium]|nr:M56 family metallopeptidase [Phycisphaerales bacterium]